MLFRSPAYWPIFKTHELRRFDYTAPDTPNFTSVFSYDVGSDSMLYNNYDANLNWLNRWYYQYRTGFGIAEWRDDYPGGKKVVLSPPIGWGEFQPVGSVYQNYPQFDFFKCWPPATRLQRSSPTMSRAKNSVYSSFKTSPGFWISRISGLSPDPRRSRRHTPPAARSSESLSQIKKICEPANRRAEAVTLRPPCPFRRFQQIGRAHV